MDYLLSYYSFSECSSRASFCTLQYASNRLPAATKIDENVCVYNGKNVEINTKESVKRMERSCRKLTCRWVNLTAVIRTIASVGLSPASASAKLEPGWEENRTKEDELNIYSISGVLESNYYKNYYEAMHVHHNDRAKMFIQQKIISCESTEILLGTLGNWCSFSVYSGTSHNEINLFHDRVSYEIQSWEAIFPIEIKLNIINLFQPHKNHSQNNSFWVLKQEMCCYQENNIY